MSDKPAFVGIASDMSQNTGTAIDDYIYMSFTIRKGEGGPEAMLGDGSRWRFNKTTVQQDVTAYELAQILAMELSVPDGVMGRIKQHDGILRHFQREVEGSPDV